MALTVVPLFVLPVVTWIAVSYAVAGGYYSHEAVAYRQFRWLPDALVIGPTAVLTEALTRAGRWLGAVTGQWKVPVALLLALVGARVATGGSLGQFVVRRRPLLESAGIVLGLGLAFWYLNGEMGTVRAATLAPVVLTVAAALAIDLDRPRRRPRWTGILAVATIGWGLAALFRPLS